MGGLLWHLYRDKSDPLMTTIGHAEDLTRSLIGGLLRENELASSELEFVDADGRRRPADAEVSDSDFLKIVVLGEEFLLGMVRGQKDSDWIRSFTDNFTTFIQESKFGFGEAR